MEGFRRFESTVANCKATGGDVFSAMQDASTQDADASQGGRRGAWGRRLHRVALACLAGAFVLKRLG